MVCGNRIQNRIIKKSLRKRLDMTKSCESRYRRHIIKRGKTDFSKLKFDLIENSESHRHLEYRVSLSMVISWLRSENFKVKSYQQGLYILNDKILTPASILIFANHLRLKKNLNIFNVERFQEG